MPTAYIRTGSGIQASFDGISAEDIIESGSGFNIYSFPESQWEEFHRHFGFESFSRIHYFLEKDWELNNLDKVAREIVQDAESSSGWINDKLQPNAAIVDGNQLYIIIDWAGNGDEENSSEKNLDDGSAIIVIRSYSDVVAIRVVQDNRAVVAYNHLHRKLTSNSRTTDPPRPDFGELFRTEFSDRVVEMFTQVWFRNDDNNDPAEVIHFQGSGDLRKSAAAADFFEKRPPYAGYAAITGAPATEFYFNWHERRISFEGHVTEDERLEASNQIIAILDLLDGYPVIRTFSGDDPLRSEVYESFYTTVWVSRTSLSKFLEYVQSRNVPGETNVVVHTIEGQQIVTSLAELDSDHSYEFTFVRVYAAAEETFNSDYVWERRGDAVFIGVANEDDSVEPVSYLYERTTESQFDPQVASVLNGLVSDLNVEGYYD